MLRSPSGAMEAYLAGSFGSIELRTEPDVPTSLYPRPGADDVEPAASADHPM